MSDFDQILKKYAEDVIKTEHTKLTAKLEKRVTNRVLDSLKVARPIIVMDDWFKKKGKAEQSHEALESVMPYIQSRIPLLLVGPAGTGKTRIAMTAAKLLKLECYTISVNEQTSKADFLGYTDATGKTIKTNFRRAFESGGVFVIDEIDAGNPNILTVINSALSNDMCPFPDGMIERHENFSCVCTANTFGEGENIQYIGRNILDAATRDRFATLYIDYSEGLERILVPNFYQLLIELRRHFNSKNINRVVSTRGGIRLEDMKQAKKKLTVDDLIDCLNLHQEVRQDSTVVNLLKNHGVA